MSQNNMSIKRNTFKIIFELWLVLTTRRRHQLIFLILLLVVTGIFEGFTVSAIVPFTQLFSNSEITDQNFFILELVRLSGLSDTFGSIITTTALFTSIVALTSILRLFSLKYGFNLTARIGVDLNTRAFHNVINQPYLTQVNRKNNDITTTIAFHTSRTVAAINSFVSLLASFSRQYLFSSVSAL